MNPTIRYELAKAQISDLHRQAQRDALAVAARRARRARPQQRSYPVRRLPAVLARRVLAVLGPGSP